MHMHKHRVVGNECHGMVALGAPAQMQVSSMDEASLCVLEDFGKNSSRCGYCKSDGTSSISHGMWAHALPAAAYQVRSSTPFPSVPWHVSN